MNVMSIVTRSPLAMQATKQWKAGRRPVGWLPVFGAFTHTTGAGLPLAAERKRRDPKLDAVDIYNETHGCNYVVGWDGEVIQVADETEQAMGVGISPGQPDQWASVSAGRGRWKDALPPDLVRRWIERWPGFANPLDLLPGTQYANAPYVQIEMIPCVFGSHSTVMPAPAGPGLRFTHHQHDSIAKLYVDLARRHSWPDEWWRTPRMLGHEDVSPLPRHDAGGGWDPGWLRAAPYFDWSHVVRQVGVLLGLAEIDATKKPRADVYKHAGPWSGL